MTCFRAWFLSLPPRSALSERGCVENMLVHIHRSSCCPRQASAPRADACFLILGDTFGLLLKLGPQPGDEWGLWIVCLKKTGKFCFSVYFLKPGGGSLYLGSLFVCFLIYWFISGPREFHFYFGFCDLGRTAGSLKSFVPAS